MDPNPFQSPSAPAAEIPHEPLSKAALRGARRGAVIGAAFPLTLYAIYFGVLGYFWLTDPERLRYILQDRPQRWYEWLEFIPPVAGLAFLGASLGAAFDTARAYGRNRRLANRNPPSPPAPG